jgi:hypothetical protein
MRNQPTSTLLATVPLVIRVWAQPHRILLEELTDTLYLEQTEADIARLGQLLTSGVNRDQAAYCLAWACFVEELAGPLVKVYPDASFEVALAGTIVWGVNAATLAELVSELRN